MKSKKFAVVKKAVNKEKDVNLKSRVIELKILAGEIRKDIITMLTRSGSGHTAGSLGMADIFATLYFDVMKHDPLDPKKIDRDFLFLSNGHICPVLYATLAKAGYFDKSELSRLRRIGSLLQGHPHNTIAGIENSSGPLGQGFSMAVGAAMALTAGNMKNQVFAICGDGELNEGQMWEAIMCASKYKLSNLTLIVDRNHIQLDGKTEDVMPLDDLGEKFNSFGWNVVKLDGNNIEEVLLVLREAKTSMIERKAPLVIIAKTIPGSGVSFMENDYHWHGKAPNAEEEKVALVEIDAEIEFLKSRNLGSRVKKR